MENLIFLKLGGSLITDKNTPRTARREIIARLVSELKVWRAANSEWRVVLGHGSGSFGHVPAKKYGTRAGVSSSDGWRGFAEVWYEATTLNRIVMAAINAAGVPAISFPISGGALAQDGQVAAWNLTPLTAALENDLLPVVFGDVVFDLARGGTIFSTEDIFRHLARELHPQRILLAGIDEGVWADFPVCTQLITAITPENYSDMTQSLSGSAATDVTGGMASKVEQMLNLTTEMPGLEVVIFNGKQPGNLIKALQGNTIGTHIHNSG
jgi:isopentenyl phosphate kinase